MQKKLEHYFETHPEATEVHVARGVLFVNKKNADNYAALENGADVETVTRGANAAKQKEIDDTAAAKQKEIDDAAAKQKENDDVAAANNKTDNKKSGK